MNPLSRFRPHKTVPVRPGCCFICKGIKGPFIDTGNSVQWEGAVYVCKTCIVEMYQQLDLNEPPVEVIKEVEVSRETSLNVLLSEIKDYVTNRLVVADLSAGNFDFDLSLPSSSFDGENEGDSNESKSDDGENVLRSSEDDAGSDGIIESSNKPNSKSGRAKLSSTASSESDSVSLNF